MEGERNAYWRAHYDRVFAEGQGALDYSSPVLQSAEFAHALRLAGRLDGKAVLDAGCGQAQLASICATLGAHPVIAFDRHEPTRIHCAADFVVGDLEENAIWHKIGGAGPFDVVFAVECLQYVNVPTALARLWATVKPGGRLVTVLANADSPIVQDVKRYHGGHYQGVQPRALNGLIRSLGAVAHWKVEYLCLAADQTIEPFDQDLVDLYGETVTVSGVPHPYRLVVVAVKA